jgi:hypothetical protein
MRLPRTIILSFCALACAAPEAQVRPPQADLAITHVGVVDARNNEVAPDRTVLIRAGRIIRVGPADETRYLGRPRVVDGTGKYLIPGLLDMHAHIAVNGRPLEVDLPLFIAHGVTGLRVMNADCRQPAPELRSCIDYYRKLQRDVETRAVLGPRLLALGSWAVNGTAGITEVMPAYFKATTAEEGRRLAQYMKERGVDFIKVYNGISAEGFAGLAEEARRLNLPFGGHEPSGVSAIDISNAGQKSIEHSRIFLLNCFPGADSLRRRLLSNVPQTVLRHRMVAEYDANKCAEVFSTFAKNRTYITPTHGTRRMDAFADDSVYRNDSRLKFVSSPQRFSWIVDANRMVSSDSSPAGRKSYMDFYRKGLELTGAAYRAGVPVMVGTDANDSYVFVGSSVHDELDELIKAGLKPGEALDAATRTGAEYLGKTADYGTIVLGRAADLVLLDANPLDDIRNVRRINSVIIGGRYLPRTALDSLLSSAEAAAKRPPGT